MPLDPSVATLVRVRISKPPTAAMDFEDIIEELAKAAKPLLDAPGHRQSAWGLLQSDHATFMLCSFWDDLAAVSGFRTSAAAETMGHNLAILGDDHPDAPSVALTTVDFGGSLDSQAVLRRHTQIRRVYFPSPVSDAARTAVRRLPGLVYRYGVGISGQDRLGRDTQRAYHRVPAVGWFVAEEMLGERAEEGRVTTKQWDGKECDELVCVMFWKDGERERKFLEEERLPVTVPGSEPGTAVWVRDMSLMEEWEGKLEEAGAVGWEDEYVDFCVV
ncbi:uncharacterized protein B0T15DRAFT_540788 [Chaetomium strumarium]|uniref:ABM domain-containing protein n=1 Tax=Chaetomium strumarium TaxID=1170767 RepID=A0AAJ0LZS9_9PEZI|nr:hypothetical protein B0T15DRAFT_540788 [Chaetomium strumarium]